MFRIILISFVSVFFAQSVFAANSKTPQTLDEINADLLVKKRSLEPFDPKAVKVDLESLGLDDVEKKDKKLVESPMEKVDTAQKEKVNAEKKSMLLPNPVEPLPLPAALPTPAPTKKEEKAKEPVIPAETTEGMFSRIQNMIKDKTPNMPPVFPFAKKDAEKSEAVKASPIVAPTTKADIKKPTEKYLNSAKKQNLKKRIVAEKKKKWDEKESREKLKKLAQLRKKYLEESGEEKIEGAFEDEDFDESPKLIPQRKDLNPFRSDELPALPILDRYRTKEDLHIPLILTIKERIALLFNTVTIGNISAFNEAYKDIENPNVQNETGDTILTYAIILKKYPVVASILAKGADPNLPNKLGYTPAHIAIELQDFKSFEMLAENRADLDYVDAFGRNYLMHASRVGLLPAVDLLVSKNGTDVNVMDNDGFTSLAIAYRYKKEIVAKYLLKHGAKTWIEKPYNANQQSLIIELEDHWKKQ